MPVLLVDHPLVSHKLGILRNAETSMKKFREVVSELTLLLTYEATRDLATAPCDVQTPICSTSVPMLADGENFTIVPILRAGLGMVAGMLEILPSARVAHIGLQRDERTALPQTYYTRLPPDLSRSEVFVIDPMLATAGSLSYALATVKQAQPKRLTAICLIAAPEGKARLEREHPDVRVFVGAIDERLDERAFIVPGLGDAGDRMFGTL